MNLINESEIFGKWAPIIESTTGIDDKGKLGWMSKYCHNHELYENNSYAQVGSVNGMGATRFPGQPTSQTGFGGQDTGSGDKPYTLLPLAMQVAAQTVGLDLVPVVPMNGPMGVLTYLDFVYGGGKVPTVGQTGAFNASTAGTTPDMPLLIKMDGAITTAPSPATASPVAGEQLVSSTGATFTFVGESRIDGFNIFKIDALPAGVNVATGLTAGTTLTWTAGGTGKITTSGVPALVKALEDHVIGFSSNTWDGSSEPMSRLQGESSIDNVMNLSLFNKSIEAKTYQVAAAVTREQVQDLKQFGIDAVAQVESVLINELTQDINRNILERLRRLGYTNHGNVYKTQGVQFNLLVGTTGGTAYANIPQLASLNSAGSDGVQVFGAAGTYNPVVASSETNSAAENLHTRQRKVMSKILATANLIAIRGRRGPATFAVTNGQVGSALQDVAGFVPAPMANTLNQQTGSLYPIGTLAGLAVYVDPYMSWNDTRVTVGRKGDGNSPGLVFMPYLMAESVQTIAEGTMAPKIAVKSRYALVEAGFHPESMYITFGVANEAGGWA
jgi:hypothetical protein